MTTEDRLRQALNDERDANHDLEQKLHEARLENDTLTRRTLEDDRRIRELEDDLETARRIIERAESTHR